MAQCRVGQKLLGPESKLNCCCTHLLLWARICWLPKAAGGDCQWSVQPQLPEGLWIDEESGCIFGSPAAPSARGLYTVAATNAGGSDSFSLQLLVESAGEQPAPCLSCDDFGCGLCSKKAASSQELQKPAAVCQLEWRKERRPEHSGWTSHSFLHALLEDGRTMRIQRFEGSDDFVAWFWPGQSVWPKPCTCQCVLSDASSQCWKASSPKQAPSTKTE